MKPTTREEVVTIREVRLSPDEVTTAETVVATYEGVSSYSLSTQARIDDEGNFVLPLRDSGGLVLSCLRQARAGAPVPFPSEGLTEEQKKLAEEMLAEYERAQADEGN